MSTTKHTINLRVRLNYFEDMEIIQRLAEAENMCDYTRDALTYYIRHEREAYKELHGNDAVPRRKHARRFIPRDPKWNEMIEARTE